jgi:sterol desaturase/sphingolipid hydroxylase (fatty acid hydroxylase superfamily)
MGRDRDVKGLWSELVGLEHGDLVALQLTATGLFFSLCYVEARLTRPRPPSKAPPELIVDMWHWLISPTVRFVARGLALGLLTVLATLVGREVGPELLHGFGPVASQPTALIVVELLLLMDLLTYLTHRLFHRVPWLWRFHAIHHSATHVRWSTAGRIHPINEILNYASTLIPCFLMGFPLSLALPLFPFLVVYALAAHTSWNPGFGPLRHVLVSPRMHRWHHTLQHEGGDKNFANVFAFWDKLFGTFYLPEDRVATTFGLDACAIPERYTAQLLYPFEGSADRPARARSITPLGLRWRRRRRTRHVRSGDLQGQP